MLNVRNKFLCGACCFSLSLTAAAQVSKQNSNPSLLQDAAQAITAGKLSRAEDDLQSVLRAAPDDYRALDLLGVVRVLQRREIEAEELFRRAIQKNPDFAPAHAHLGLLYVQKGVRRKQFPSCARPCASTPLAAMPRLRWCASCRTRRAPHRDGRFPKGPRVADGRPAIRA